MSMTAVACGPAPWSWFGFGVDPFGDPRRPVPANMFTLGVLLPGASLWALYRIATTSIATTSIAPPVWILAGALYLFTLFGVTLGNHRYWTHRGFKAHGSLRVLLAVGSALSLQGDIEQWVLTHRNHHKYADIVGFDPTHPSNTTVGVDGRGASPRIALSNSRCASFRISRSVSSSYCSRCSPLPEWTWSSSRAPFARARC